jgi:hypothetical protein
MAFPGRWWHEPDAEDGEDDGAISVGVFHVYLSSRYGSTNTPNCTSVSCK